MILEDPLLTKDVEKEISKATALNAPTLKSDIAILEKQKAVIDRSAQ